MLKTIIKWYTILDYTDKVVLFLTVTIFIIGSIGLNKLHKINPDVIEEIPSTESVDEFLVIEELTEWDYLIAALIEVESEGNPYAVGSSNDLGILQITPIYVREVNRILKDDLYSLDQRTDIDKSLEMFEIYQSHHNPSRSISRAIKLHNPGAGQWYHDKVMKEFNKLIAQT